MNEDNQRRLARNEALFREVNEAIERGQWPDPGKVVRFRCECSRLDCSAAVPITLAEYEHVRSDPRRFIVLEGHEIPEIESVVSRGEGVAVVEKQDVAGRTAVASDPRS